MVKYDFVSALDFVFNVFDEELVKGLFPGVYDKADLSIGIENLKDEILEVQREVFGIDSTNDGTFDDSNITYCDDNGNNIVCYDNALKVNLVDGKNVVLLVHIELGAEYSFDINVLNERMFRYFYLLLEKMKYRKNQNVEIVPLVICDSNIGKCEETDIGRIYREAVTGILNSKKGNRKSGICKPINEEGNNKNSLLNSGISFKSKIVDIKELASIVKNIEDPKMELLQVTFEAFAYIASGKNIYGERFKSGEHKMLLLNKLDKLVGIADLDDILVVKNFILNICSDM